MTGRKIGIQSPLGMVQEAICICVGDGQLEARSTKCDYHTYTTQFFVEGLSH